MGTWMVLGKVPNLSRTQREPKGWGFDSSTIRRWKRMQLACYTRLKRAAPKGVGGSIPSASVLEELGIGKPPRLESVRV